VKKVLITHETTINMSLTKINNAIR